MTIYKKLELELETSANNTDAFNNVLVSNSPSCSNPLPPKLKLKFNDITLYIYYIGWLNHHAITKNDGKSIIYFSSGNERAKGCEVYAEGPLDLKDNNKFAHFLVTSGFRKVIPFIFGDIKDATTSEIVITEKHIKRYELLKSTSEITTTLDWIYSWEKKQKQDGIIPDGIFKDQINKFIEKYNLKTILDTVNNLTSENIYRLDNYDEILKLNAIINNPNNKTFLEGIEKIVDDVNETAIKSNINEAIFFGLLSGVTTCIGVISLLFLIGIIPGNPGFTVLAGFGLIFLLGPSFIFANPPKDEKDDVSYENFSFFNQLNGEKVTDFKINEEDQEVLVCLNV